MNGEFCAVCRVQSHIVSIVTCQPVVLTSCWQKPWVDGRTITNPTSIRKMSIEHDLFKPIPPHFNLWCPGPLLLKCSYIQCWMFLLWLFASQWWHSALVVAKSPPLTKYCGNHWESLTLNVVLQVECLVDNDQRRTGPVTLCRKGLREKYCLFSIQLP